MAYSIAITAATAGQTIVAVPFPYRDEVDVHLIVDDIEIHTYSWPTSSTLEVETPFVGGEVVKVQRLTPAAQALVSFGPGAITSKLLNTQIRQLLYINQEALDRVVEVVVDPEVIQDYMDNVVTPVIEQKVEDVVNDLVDVVPRVEALETGQADLNTAVTGNTTAIGQKAALAQVVRHDTAQSLSSGQQTQAKTNIGVVEPSTYVANATNRDTPLSTDFVYGLAQSGNPIKTGWTNFKAFLKSYFDGLYATISHTHTFASITSKPTTKAGYGITDVATIPANSSLVVGSCVLAGLVNSGSVANNATIAGSSLRRVAVRRDNDVGNSGVVQLSTATLPGTWRNVSGENITFGGSGISTIGGEFVRTA